MSRSLKLFFKAVRLAGLRLDKVDLAVGDYWLWVSLFTKVVLAINELSIKDWDELKEEFKGFALNESPNLLDGLRICENIYWLYNLIGVFFFSFELNLGSKELKFYWLIFDLL